MGCSSVGWLDSCVLGISHLYIAGSNVSPTAAANFGFDPEALRDLLGITHFLAVFPAGHGDDFERGATHVLGSAHWARLETAEVYSGGYGTLGNASSVLHGGRNFPVGLAAFQQATLVALLQLVHLRHCHPDAP